MTLESHEDLSDDELSSPAESSPHFGDFCVETFENNEPQQPSRSGITSTFVVDSANQMDVEITTPNTGAFSLSDAAQPNRPSRTSDWQDQQSQRRSNRNSNVVEMSGGDRVTVSNFGVIFEVNNQDGIEYARRTMGLDRQRDDRRDENLNRNPGT